MNCSISNQIELRWLDEMLSKGFVDLVPCNLVVPNNGSGNVRHLCRRRTVVASCLPVGCSSEQKRQRTVLKFQLSSSASVKAERCAPWPLLPLGAKLESLKGSGEQLELLVPRTDAETSHRRVNRLLRMIYFRSSRDSARFKRMKPARIEYFNYKSGSGLDSTHLESSQWNYYAALWARLVWLANFDFSASTAAEFVGYLRFTSSNNLWNRSTE